MFFMRSLELSRNLQNCLMTHNNFLYEYIAYRFTCLFTKSSDKWKKS